MNGHFALLNRLRDGSVLGDFIREGFGNKKLEYVVRTDLLLG